MRRNLWIRAVWVAAATAGPAAMAAGPPVAVPNDPAARRAALVAADTPAAIREELARRLFVAATPADVATLRQALTTGPREATGAVLQALTDAESPDPSLLPQVVALLGSARSAEAAAAVAAYAGSPVAPAALDGLRRFIADNRASPLARAPAVGNLARFTDHAAAADLVNLVSTGPPTLAAAAAAGLAELSGEADRGTSGAAWQAWWAGHRQQGPAAWAEYLLAVRTAAGNRDRAQRVLLAADAGRLLKDVYRQLPPAAQGRALLGYLNDPAAPIRATGAELVGEEVVLNHPVADDALRRVADLVGDDSPTVRLAAIETERTAVDRRAGAALVAQLRVERVPSLQKLLMQAVGKLQVLDAAPALIDLLSSPRPDVAAAAARTLGEPTAGIGRALKAQRPDKAKDVAAALRQAISARAAGPRPESSADNVRAACVRALSAVSDAQTLGTLRQLLEEMDPDVKVASLDGLGSLGDDHADQIVASELGDRNYLVRLAAAKAMRTVARPEDADQLANKLNPHGEESDPSVRQAAWEALQRLLATGSIDLLNSFAERLRDDPEKVLVVRQDLDRALTRAGKADEAASNDQQMATLLMDLHRPAEAIAPLQAALDYYQRNAPAGGTPGTNLVDQMLHARVGAGQYAAAVDFAAAQVKADPSLRGSIGRLFEDAAESLRVQGQAADCVALADAALAMQPPLSGQYVAALQQIRSDAQAAPRDRRR